MIFIKNLLSIINKIKIFINMETKTEGEDLRLLSRLTSSILALDQKKRKIEVAERKKVEALLNVFKRYQDGVIVKGNPTDEFLKQLQKVKCEISSLQKMTKKWEKFYPPRLYLYGELFYMLDIILMVLRILYKILEPVHEEALKFLHYPDSELLDE